jgi:predicted DNA-binding transcriptional regulator AlpA
MENTVGKPLNITEVAAFTGLKSSYLYKLVHLNWKVYFKREDLEASFSRAVRRLTMNFPKRPKGF